MTLGLLFVAGFVSWLVSTIGAGGGAMLLVPLVGFLLGAQAVAPVVTLATIVGSGGRLWVFRDSVEWRIVAWALPGALVGAAIGAWVFTRAPVLWLQLAIGLFLLSAPFQYRFGRRKQTFGAKRWYFLPAQLVVGAVSGLLGAVGPVLNILYLNAGIGKERIVGTKTVVSTPMHLVKIGTYSAFGALSDQMLLFGAAAGAGALLSNVVAKRVLKTLPGERFRQIVTGLMALSGAAMLWQALN
jgi:uncharacterized protein